MNTQRILIVDDEESLRFTFKSFLLNAGFDVDTADCYENALEKLSESEFSLIIADILLGDKTGIDLLREVKERKLNCYVIMVTGYPNVESASEAVRLGAFDYISKPVREDTLLHATRMALNQKTLADESEKHRAHVKAILKSVKDGIITVDTNQKVTSANASAEGMFGFSAEAIINHEFGGLSGECIKKCTELITETISSQKDQTLKRYEYIGHDEKKRVVTLKTSPLIVGTEKFSGVVLVVSDETRMADLEANLKGHKQYGKIIGKCANMQNMYAMLDNLKNIQTTVLITGETGTGKELIADALHFGSDSGERPFVKVNCAALPENLLESELFGHVKGAFTGAISNKIGRFQKANGGTILLDEIGEISPRIQLRLLRVLQEKEFEKVGESTTIKVNVRVIAATNVDLQKKVQNNEFREDLYYRLNVVNLNVPPLRERLQDIPMLAAHFIDKFNKEFGKDIEGVSEEVISFFLSYQWPGNVRELEHVIEHAFVVCHESLINMYHMPDSLIQSKSHSTIDGSFSEKASLDDVAVIRAALEKTDWNKAKAARLLGVSRQTIYRKIEELGLEEG